MEERGGGGGEEERWERDGCREREDIVEGGEEDNGDIREMQGREKRIGIGGKRAGEGRSERGSKGGREHRGDNRKVERGGGFKYQIIEWVEYCNTITIIIHQLILCTFHDI